MIKDCNICSGTSVRSARNSEIYGREYGNGMCFICDDCGAFVGCHPDGKPLGILANKEMRELKKQCHALFDPVWKDKKLLKRNEVYYRLSKRLGIEQKDCHFGHFDIPMLEKALEVLRVQYWYVEN